jgi:hypothetical protein
VIQCCPIFLDFLLVQTITLMHFSLRYRGKWGHCYARHLSNMHINTAGVITARNRRAEQEIKGDVSHKEDGNDRMGKT